MYGQSKSLSSLTRGSATERKFGGADLSPDRSVGHCRNVIVSSAAATPTRRWSFPLHSSLRFDVASFLDNLRSRLLSPTGPPARLVPTFGSEGGESVVRRKRSNPQIEAVDFGGGDLRKRYRMSLSYGSLDTDLDMESMEHRPQPRKELQRVSSRRRRSRNGRVDLTRSMDDLLLGDTERLSPVEWHGSSRSLLSLASDKEDDLSQENGGEESSSEEFPVTTQSDEETLDDELDNVYQTEESCGKIELVTGLATLTGNYWRGMVTQDLRIRLFSGDSEREINQAQSDMTLSEDELTRVSLIKPRVVFNDES